MFVTSNVLQGTAQGSYNFLALSQEKGRIMSSINPHLFLPVTQVYTVAILICAKLKLLLVHTISWEIPVKMNTCLYCINIFTVEHLGQEPRHISSIALDCL